MAFLGGGMLYKQNTGLGPAAIAFQAWLDTHTVLFELDPRKERDNEFTDGQPVEYWRNTGTNPTTFEATEGVIYRASYAGYSGPVFDLTAGSQLVANSEQAYAQPNMHLVIGNFGQSGRLFSSAYVGGAYRQELMQNGAKFAVYAGAFIDSAVDFDTNKHAFGFQANGANSYFAVDSETVVTGTTSGDYHGGVRYGAYNATAGLSSPIIAYGAIIGDIVDQADFEQGLALAAAYEAEAFTVSVNGSRASEGAGPTLTPTSTSYIEAYGKTIASTNDVANAAVIADRVAFAIHVPKAITIDRLTNWWRTGITGYSAGDGGIYKVTVEGDNAGQPDGVVQSTIVTDEVIDVAGGLPALRTSSMSSALIQPGIAYIIYKNVHGDPANNYCSLNGPYMASGAGAPYGELDKTRPAMRLYRETSPGVWGDFDANTQLGYLPMMAIGNATESVGQEMQYGEHVNGHPRLAGNTRFRQNITILDTPVGTVNKLNIHVGRVSGTDPLEIYLDGVLVKTISGMRIIPDPVLLQNQKAIHYQWIQVDLPTSLVKDVNAIVELRSGGTYRVGAGVRNTTEIQVGRYSGRAEISTDAGVTWKGLDYNGPADLPNGMWSINVHA